MKETDLPYPALAVAEEVDKVLRALRDRVRLASITQRQIERRHGWNRGYLSQVLSGHISLGLLHVLAILDSLQLEPAAFFAEVLGRPAELSGEIRERLARYDAALAELEAKGFLGGDSSVVGDKRKNDTE